MKIALITLFMLIHSSCEIASLLAGPTNNDELIKELELKADWRGNLIGLTVLEGSVCNKHYREVWDVTIRAKVYDKSSSLVETNEFKIDVRITSNGVATFKNYISTDRKNVSSVAFEIVFAKD